MEGALLFVALLGQLTPVLQVFAFAISGFALLLRKNLGWSNWVFCGGAVVTMLATTALVLLFFLLQQVPPANPWFGLREVLILGLSLVTLALQATAVAQYLRQRQSSANLWFTVSFLFWAGATAVSLLT